MRAGRWLGTFAVLTVMTFAGQAGAQAASASGAALAGRGGLAGGAGGTTIGPVQISALGHPRLCWEAGGNGSGVTLEHCDHALQGQQWSLTPDGVLMNGNGYCLEAAPGRPLFIDFAAQCAGAPGQLWHYRAAHLTSPVSAAGSAGSGGTAPGAAAGAGTCAATAGPPVPGAEIVGSTCSPPALAAGSVSRWSIGTSAVTVTPGAGRGPAGGTFGASVTVANAASAQAAYGVSVTFTLPPGISASTLRATASALRAAASAPGSAASAPGSATSGLRCDVATLTCTGTLAAGASRQITLTGPVPAAVRPGDSYPLRVHVTVSGTTQRSRTARTTATLTVTVTPAAPQPRSPLPLIAAVATLVLVGILLVIITRRRAPAAPRTPVSAGGQYPRP